VHDDEEHEDAEADEDADDGAPGRRRSSRARWPVVRKAVVLSDDDDDDEIVVSTPRPAPTHGRATRSRGQAAVAMDANVDAGGDAEAVDVDADADGLEDPLAVGGVDPDVRADPDADAEGEPELDADTASLSKRRLSRRRPPAKRPTQDDSDYVDHPASADPALSPSLSPEPDAEGSADDFVDDDDDAPRTYGFRKRKQVNYALPPPLEELRAPPPKPAPRKGRGAGGGGRPPPRRLGWSAGGAQLSRWMGDHDSDSDAAPPPAPAALAGGAGAGLFAGDASVAGGPSNMGKLGDAALADADPLGVNTAVTFDEVGGLDERAWPARVRVRGADGRVQTSARSRR
jgi:hypothetical protein